MSRGKFMNASEIITEDMTLEEKLSAIDQAMKNAQAQAEAQAKEKGEKVFAPIDPAELTMCDGCQ